VYRFEPRVELDDPPRRRPRRDLGSDQQHGYRLSATPLEQPPHNAGIILLAPTPLLCPRRKKGRPYSITERRVPEMIPVLGSQPAGDVSRKPGCRLPLLSARPAVTPATLKWAATNFAAW